MSIALAGMAYVAHQDYLQKFNSTVTTGLIKKETLRTDVERHQYARTTLLHQRLRDWIQRIQPSGHQHASTKERCMEGFLHEFQLEEERKVVQSIQTYGESCMKILVDNDNPTLSLEVIGKLKSAYKTLYDTTEKIRRYVGHTSNTRESRKRELKIRNIFERVTHNKVQEQKEDCREQQLVYQDELEADAKALNLKPDLEVTKEAVAKLVQEQKEDITAEFQPDGIRDVCALIGMESLFDFLRAVDLFFSTEDVVLQMHELMELPAVTTFIHGYYASLKLVDQSEIAARIGGDFAPRAPLSCRKCQRSIAYYLTFNGYCVLTSIWALGLVWISISFFYSNQMSSFFTTDVKPFLDGEENFEDDRERFLTGLTHMAYVTLFVCCVAFMYFTVPAIYRRLPRFKYCVKVKAPTAQYCCPTTTYDWELAKFARINRQRHRDNFEMDRIVDPVGSMRDWFEYDSENELPDINTLYWHLEDARKMAPLMKPEEMTFKFDRIHVKAETKKTKSKSATSSKKVVPHEKQ